MRLSELKKLKYLESFAKANQGSSDLLLMQMSINFRTCLVYLILSDIKIIGGIGKYINNK